MITRNCMLFVGEDKCELKSKIILYQGDRNVQINFELNQFPYTFETQSSFLIDDIRSLTEATAKCVIKKPNGRTVLVDSGVVKDNIVSFVITADIIDELDEIGTHEAQVRIYTAVDNARISLHPFTFEIKEPISQINDDPILNAQVDYSESDIGKVAAPVGLVATSDAWKTGELITAEKLNMTMRFTSGTYANRPNQPKMLESYFDTDLQTLIFWNGSKWLDMFGNDVSIVHTPTP